MTLSLMLCGVLIASALTLAAHVLHAQERAANRPVRWIWAAAVGLTVVLTAIVPLRERLGAAPTRTIAGALDTQSQLVLEPARNRSPLDEFAQRVRAGVLVTLVPVRSVLQVAANASPAVQTASRYAWLTVSTALLLVLLAVYRRARRTSASWQRARVFGTDVRVSESAGPAVIGLNPMEIVVPSWVLCRAPEEQQLVLRHELEHMRAHDPALLVCACLAVVMMPWNPLLWYALSRLRLAVEIDCDRRVLQRGVAPLTYGRLLLDLSAHPSSLSNSLPALSYHTSHLERRLLAMTARPARFVIARRVSGAVVAAAALLAACESKLPTSAEIHNMDAAAAVAHVSKVRAIDSMRTEFIVDGKSVTSAEAKSLSASQIASIEVVKGTDRSAQVRMRTKQPDSLRLTGEKIPMYESFAIADGAKLAPTRSAPLQIRSKTAFTGLFIIDGKEATELMANSISPDRIATVEVIKGDAAARLYPDPRARDGVIVITTKQ